MKASTFTIACIVVPLLAVSCSIPAVILDGRDPEGVQRGSPHRVDEARIEDRTIFVDIICGDFDSKPRDFRLFMTPENFQGSKPRHASLLLTYDNGGGRLLDGCNRMTLRFDLSPVLDRYRKQYGGEDEIILKFSGSKTVVRYSP